MNLHSIDIRGGIPERRIDKMDYPICQADISRDDGGFDTVEGYRPRAVLRLVEYIGIARFRPPIPVLEAGGPDNVVGNNLHTSTSARSTVQDKNSAHDCYRRLTTTPGSETTCGLSGEAAEAGEWE